MSMIVTLVYEIDSFENRKVPANGRLLILQEKKELDERNEVKISALIFLLCFSSLFT